MPSFDTPYCLTMTDLMELEQWKELERKLHETTGMNAGACNSDGAMFTGFKAWANRLCPRIKSEPAGIQAICAVANKAMMARAKEQKCPIIEQCDAGLSKICVPIFVDGVFVGSIGGCGVLRPGDEVETFLVHKALGADESEIVELASDVPVMDVAALNAVAVDLEKQMLAVVEHFKARKG